MYRQRTLSLLLFAAIGCSSGGNNPITPPPPPPPPPPPAASVSIAPGSLTLQTGQSGGLTATVRDAGGNVIGAGVTWSSVPASVATVNSNGQVTAVAEGTATVTARVGTIEASVTITVNPVPVATVTLSDAPPEIEVGAARTITAVTRSASGATLSGRTVAWMSSNTAAATVDDAGQVTGVAPGETTITASSEGQSAMATIKVNTRAAFLAAIVDSIRNAFNLPAMGAAVTTRSGLFGEAAAGKRRMSLAELATTNDLWHIGSNLKAITGHVAAIAVDAGAITWNTTLAQAYPEFAATLRPEYETVTLRMLLGHIGGIAVNIEDQDIPGTGTLTAQRSNIAEWATSIAPVVPIGQYTYSNVGFMIAANMVERALGISWEEVMQTRLLGPLGITQFGWGAAPWQQNQNPIGHMWTAGAWVENASDNPPYHSAAGRSHWSLAAWARVMQDVLQADQNTSPLVGQAAARMVTSAIAPNGYAGGWETISSATWSQGRGVHHAGSNSWHYSMAQVALDRGAAIVVVTNATETAGTRHIDGLNALLARLWTYYTLHAS
jgi:CubicO group peptidase (beta-lactamase class C family)